MQILLCYVRRSKVVELNKQVDEVFNTPFIEMKINIRRSMITDNSNNKNAVSTAGKGYCTG